ncbi:MAG TPA: hypothetical protein PLE30_05670 [Candidatus Kapabacteria bacterium]|nr:hypothetical protein [Candidatus Kapabacteria bacterium]
MKKFILFFLIVPFFLACSNPQETTNVEQPTRIALAKINNSNLKEISGMAESRIYNDILWVHNDSDDKPRIFALNLKGEILAEVYLKNALNYDWEEIKIVVDQQDNKPLIYIADTGDNLLNRNDCKFYVLQEPIIDTNKRNVKTEVDSYRVINFQYQDKPHNCEAFFVDNNVIHLLTKSDSLSKYYTISNPSFSNNNIANYQLDTKLGQYRTRFPMSSIVGADLSKDKQHLLIKSYDSIYYYKNIDDWKATFVTEPLFVNYVPEIQGETVAWKSDNSGYWTLSEVGPLDVKQTLYFYKFTGPMSK